MWNCKTVWGMSRLQYGGEKRDKSAKAWIFCRLFKKRCKSDQGKAKSPNINQTTLLVKKTKEHLLWGDR